MTTPTLLPCPFCGSSDLSFRTEMEGIDYRTVIECTDYVACGNCGAQGPPVGSTEMLWEDAAAADWNQRSAWQPIETAPGDGRDFIAYNKFTGPYITAAKAMPPDDEIRYPMYCWHGVKGSWFPKPTHWQPLPSPPPITPSR